MAEEEPTGLGLSLDDLINQQNTEKGGGRGGYGPTRRGRGRGRGVYAPPPYAAPPPFPMYPPAPAPYMFPGFPPHHQHLPQQLQHQGQSYDRFRPRNDFYRLDQKCFRDKDTGDIIVKFKNTDVVRVNAAGDITLQTDGFFNIFTLATMNEALKTVGIKVTVPNDDIKSGEWSITEGKSLTRYHDGVVLAAKGPQMASRGQQLIDGFSASLNRARDAVRRQRESERHQQEPGGYYNGRGRGDARYGGGDRYGGGGSSVFNRLGHDDRGRGRPGHYQPY
jgi:hypothetical protein